MVPLAFGTQTAGSLSRPASYCGVWALKATHDRYPLEGIKGLSPSLDTLGRMARSARRPGAAARGAGPAGLCPAARRGPPRPRLLFSPTHLAPMLDAGGTAAWAEGLQRLGAAGIPLKNAALPSLLAALFEAQKTIMAWETCRSLAAELASRLQGVDALLVPAAPGEAPLGLAATGDPAFSRVWNLLGNPCVNVPGLFGPHRMPIGLQLVGHPQRERELLAVAKRVGEVLGA